MKNMEDIIYKGIFLFSRSQKRNFVKLIKGIVGCVRPTINRISKLYGGKITQSALNRFITNSKWNSLQIVIAKIIAFINKDDRYALIIDDTLCEKYGSNLQGANYNKSHVRSGYEYSRCIVSCGLKNIKTGKYFSLLDFLYIDKKSSEKFDMEFKTKLEIACFFVDFCIQNNIKLFSVLFDSWYANNTTISHIKNIPIVSQLKSSLKIKKSNEIIKLSKYKKEINRRKMKKIKARGREFFYIEEEFFVNSFEKEVKLVFVHEKGQKQIKVLFSTARNWTSKMIIMQYMKRQDIEVYFRDIKQNLGANLVSHRNKDSFEKYFSILSFTYNVFSSLKTKTFDTFGKVIERYRNHFIKYGIDSI